jgi:Fe-S cluster biogenesis protein NfuA
MNMEDRIRKVLTEKVNPILASHFGGAELAGVEDNIVKVRLTGACSSCPSAQLTLEDIVKSVLQEEIPEIKDVILDTSVSEELLEMARKILSKKDKTQ